MPLVPARCPNCGDNIEVDESKEAAICPSCGVAYIVEKAINNYGTIIQGENVTINNGETFDRESLLNEALDRLDVPERAKRRIGAKWAIEALDVVFKQGGMSKEFTNLRVAIKTVYTQDSRAIDYQELHSINMAFMDVVVRIAQGESDFPSSEQDERLWAVWENVVADGWMQYADDLPTLIRKTKDYQAFIDVVLAMLNCVHACLNMSRLPEVRLERESSKQPLHCPSFWAEVARRVLEPISLCYNEDNRLTAEQVERIYDLADEYQQVEGVFRKEEFSSRLTPIYRGGEGVHVHRTGYVEDGKHYTKSDCEYNYYKIRIQNQCPRIYTHAGNSSCGCALAALAVFIGCIIIDWPELGVLSFFVMFIAGFLARCNSEDDGKQESILSDLYNIWCNSPTRGTQSPDMSLEEFKRWLIPPPPKPPEK